MLILFLMSTERYFACLNVTLLFDTKAITYKSLILNRKTLSPSLPPSLPYHISLSLIVYILLTFFVMVRYFFCLLMLIVIEKAKLLELRRSSVWPSYKTVFLGMNEMLFLRQKKNSELCCNMRPFDKRNVY